MFGGTLAERISIALKVIDLLRNLLADPIAHVSLSVQTTRRCDIPHHERDRTPGRGSPNPRDGSQCIRVMPSCRGSEVHGFKKDHPEPVPEDALRSTASLAPPNATTGERDWK